jgi:hypothetical protein
MSCGVLPRPPAGERPPKLKAHGSLSAPTRDSLVLYTVTCDAALRIFIPVLDSPQYLQLHATVDLCSSMPSQPLSRQAEKPISGVFYLNRDVFSSVLTAVLTNMSDNDDAKIRRIKDIRDGGWDMFMHILPNGSLSIRALAVRNVLSVADESLIFRQNIDRRPPTLLKQFTLLQNVIASLPCAPSYLHVVPGPTKYTLGMVSTAPLSVHVLEPLNFFDSCSDALLLCDRALDYVSDEDSHIKKFVRTPDGTGLAVVRESGGETWVVRDFGTILQRASRWTVADYVVVLNGGKFK